MSTDWTKPVYEKDTKSEVFALRHPDGSVYLYEDYRVRVMTVDGQDLGWWRQDHPSFSNILPEASDWWRAQYMRCWPDGTDTVNVRYGRRNGIPFAEVVE